MSRAPFRQEPDPEIFFADAGRNEVLQHLLTDIAGGKNLIRLTGGEGVGKTLLYLVLTEKLSGGSYEFVCLDHPVGSFEELLRIICLALGRDSSNERKQQRDYQAELREHLGELAKQRRRLVLIIDEAEKVFLASLERLIRLICEPAIADLLQILLIGRPALDRNIEQLAVYCSNLDVSSSYSLPPLTWQETKQYLQFRLKGAGIAGEKHRMLFSSEAVDAIQRIAAGNIRLINILAEKGLQRASREGMFQIGPFQIEPVQKKEVDITGKFGRMIGVINEYRRWVLAGVSVLLILVLVSVWPEQREKPPARNPDLLVEEMFDSQQAQDPKEHSPVQEDESAADDIKVPASGKAVTRQQEPASRRAEARVDSVQPRKPVDEGATAVPAEKKVISQQEPAGRLAETRDNMKKAERNEMGKAPFVRVQENKRKNRVQPASDAEPRDADEIYRERLRATSNWLAWSYKNGYTIQLMVLASEDAEANLKKLLVRDDYARVSDELYILRKTSPVAILVFHGLYDSREGARKVLGDLPDFLRQHEPYVLSITDALQKTAE